MRSRSDIEENQIEEGVNTDKDSSNPLVQKWKQFRPSKMERYLDIYYLIAICTIIESWVVWNQLAELRIIAHGWLLRSIIQLTAKYVVEHHTIGSGSLINAEDIDSYINERSKDNFWTILLLPNEPKFQFDRLLYAIPSVIDMLMLQNGFDIRVLIISRTSACIYGIVHCTIVKNLWIRKFEEHKRQKEKQRKEQGIYYN